MNPTKDLMLKCASMIAANALNHKLNTIQALTAICYLSCGEQFFLANKDTFIELAGIQEKKTAQENTPK